MLTVYFDAEFTTLDENGVRGLISLGCVTQNGEEFYAELTDTWDEVHCSMFVIETVLPLLEGGEHRMPVEQFAMRLKAWIEGLTDKQVIFRSDYPSVDWPFLEEIFNVHGWPKNLRKTCGTIYFNHDYQIDRYQQSLADYWKIHSTRQHHALIDARSLLFAWNAAIKGTWP